MKRSNRTLSNHELAVRLSRLEAQNARLRRSGAAALLGLGCALLLAMSAREPAGPRRGDDVIRAKLVEAEQIRIIRDRVQRVRVGTDADGAVEIEVRDGQGKPRISIEVARDGAAGFEIRDPGGTLRALLTAAPDSATGFGLFDKDGRPVQMLLPELERQALELLERAKKLQGELAPEVERKLEEVRGWLESLGKKADKDG